MKVQFGFVCDDARQEDNGKLIFIGVYTSNILVPEVPATLVLTLIAAADLEAPIDATMEFAAVLNGKTIVSGTGSAKADTLGRSFLPVKNIPLKLGETGQLSFRLRFNEAEWQTVCTMPLELKSST